MDVTVRATDRAADRATGRAAWPVIPRAVRAAMGEIVEGRTVRANYRTAEWTAIPASERAVGRATPEAVCLATPNTTGATTRGMREGGFEK